MNRCPDCQSTQRSIERRGHLQVFDAFCKRFHGSGHPSYLHLPAKPQTGGLFKASLPSQVILNKYISNHVDASVSPFVTDFWFLFIVLEKVFMIFIENMQKVSPAAVCTKAEWRKGRSQLFDRGETTI